MMRTLALTKDLVRHARQPVADPGPPPDTVTTTEDEWRAIATEILADHPADAPLWIFAYGSLLWQPAFRVAQEVRATAHGWHRAFALRLHAHRGSPERPGLMMGLDRGGACTGLAFRMDEPDPHAALVRLIGREMPLRPAGHPPTNAARWLDLDGDAGPLRALGFTLDRDSPGYARDLTPERTADLVATGVGPAGTCAEYLQRTVDALEVRGIHDADLWALQAAVADRLR